MLPSATAMPLYVRFFSTPTFHPSAIYGDIFVVVAPTYVFKILLPKIICIT